MLWKGSPPLFRAEMVTDPLLRTDVFVRGTGAMDPAEEQSSNPALEESDMSDRKDMTVTEFHQWLQQSNDPQLYYGDGKDARDLLDVDLLWVAERIGDTTKFIPPGDRIRRIPIGRLEVVVALLKYKRSGIPVALARRTEKIERELERDFAWMQDLAAQSQGNEVGQGLARLARMFATFMELAKVDHEAADAVMEQWETAVLSAWERHLHQE